MRLPGIQARRWKHMGSLTLAGPESKRGRRRLAFRSSGATAPAVGSEVHLIGHPLDLSWSLSRALGPGAENLALARPPASVLEFSDTAQAGGIDSCGPRKRS